MLGAVLQKAETAGLGIGQIVGQQDSRTAGQLRTGRRTADRAAGTGTGTMVSQAIGAGRVASANAA